MAITKTGSATFSITCGTSGATIKHTMDGNNPTSDSETYSAKKTVTKNTTVKAMGMKSGLLNSEIATEEIIIKLPTPVVTPSVDGDSGTIKNDNASSYGVYEGVSFQVSKDNGAFSTVTFPYTLTANGKYKFKAVSAGENADSDVSTELNVSTMKVDTPVINVE